jgi:subtilisin family serine protease
VVQNFAPSWGIHLVLYCINLYSQLLISCAGLTRINKRDLENVDGTYYYQGTAGAGVMIYVLDTGVYTSHSEFEDRVKWGANFAGDGLDYDGDGHGTHVMGTCLGVNVGLAKKASGTAVKVLDIHGVGSVLTAILGIDWMTTDHAARAAEGKNRSVANLSLGGGYSATLNAAVDAAVDGGIVFVSAAGNDADTGDGDACNYSPASAVKGITVSATDSRDTRPSWANWGSCVELFAPGASITSAYIGSIYTYASLSGTSMASPHVAGVAAAQWGSFPHASAAEVIARMQELATPDKVIDPRGTPNLLLWADYQCSGKGNLSGWQDVVCVLTIINVYY